MRKLKYRSDIDGLRGMAVLSVILYHFNISFFSGGYLGVDIFFVISGYLISLIILTDIKKKSFSLIEFWKRRITRILPSLFSVIFFSLLFFIFLMPQEEFEKYLDSIVSSIYFFSNFHFQFQTNYFDISSEYKPLLHTWSLAIEEQFYIIFPIIILILFKRKYLFFFILIFLFSLGFSQWGGNINRSYPYIERDLLFFNQSYFAQFMFPFGRIWELLLGFFAAYLVFKKKKLIFSSKGKNLNNIAFFFLLFSIILFDKNTPYPSFYTLIPCLSVFCLIIFKDEESIAYKILSIKSLVRIGIISYSLYLFHYPIFSIFKYSLVDIDQNLFYIFISLLIVFTISFLNYEFIEKKFRFKIRFSYTATAILFSYVFLSVFVLVYSSSLKPLLNQNNLSQNILNSFETSNEVNNCFKNDVTARNFTCQFGNLEKENFDFIILGDSHSVSYHNFFKKFSKEKNLKGALIASPACIPLLNTYILSNKESKFICKNNIESIYKFIRENEIKNIILISRWTNYTDGDYFGNKANYISDKEFGPRNLIESKKSFQLGIKNTISKFSEINTNVIIFDQPPEQKFNAKFVYRILSKKNKLNSEHIAKKSINFKDHEKLKKFTNSTFKSLKKNNKYNFKYFKLENYMCDLNTCVIGDENGSFYRDDNHLSFNGVDRIFVPLKIFLLNNIIF
tara:strand:- start:25009 stop:27042 length:2034 start_codon:yes stop_codon:yes gene_type:complete